MFNKTKIYTAYEKPEALEPTDRVELVREGFAFWAFAFHVFWLLSKRLWLAAIAFAALFGAVTYGSMELGLPTLAVSVLQMLLQLGLAFLAYDLQRAKLAHHGYRFAGVIVAESPLMAERRYYEHAA